MLPDLLLSPVWLDGKEACRLLLLRTPAEVSHPLGRLEAFVAARRVNRLLKSLLTSGSV